MAISKSSAEYYNLEKVAEVLSVPTAEVNRLREQGKLRGYRDGSTWKFLKEEIHTYLADSIKARSAGSNGHTPGDSGFDLAGDIASSSSFDLLDAVLPDDDQLVSASPAPVKSDLDLAALDQDDELSLAEETHISSLVIPPKSPKKEASKMETPSNMETSFSKVVHDDDDSDALILASSDKVHDIVFDESSVLEAGASSPQLGLAGDSGFDMLVAGDDESDLLHVADEHTDVAVPIAEFVLEPSPQTEGDDDSESSSQVIAIDVGLAAEAQNTDPFGEDGFGNFSFEDSGIQTPPAATTNDPFGAGVSALPDAFATPAVTVSPKKAAVPEEEYSTGMLIALISALVVMSLPGIMLLDTMVHMWSWGDPFILNSILMGTIAGWFGL
jgi:excisionase family DNA binding protein